MEPQIFRATDIDEMAAAFTGWQMQVVQQECGKFHGQLNGFSTAGGQINFYSASIDRRVFANGHHVPGSVMFTFIECPTASTWNGANVNPLKLFISDAERGFDLDAGKGFVSYSVSVDLVLLKQWIWEEGFEIPKNWNFSLDFNKTKFPEVAMQFRRVIANALYRGDFDIVEFKCSLFSVLNPLSRESLSRISINFAPIHDSIEMIHEALRLGKEVHLQNVLESYGGPARTFYYNFKKYTGFTPHQYIKNLRLAAVHKSLKIADPGIIGVREVAYQFGFRHLGQFAHDYNNLFGEVPSHRLRRPASKSNIIY